MRCFLLTSTTDLVLIFSSASSTCLTSPPSLMKSLQGQRNTVGDIKIKHFCDFNSQTTSKIWSTCLSSVMLSLIWQGRMKKKETDFAVSNPFILPYNIFFFKKSKTNIFSIKIKSGLFVLPRTQNWKDPDFATLDPLLLPSNMSNTPLPSSLSLWKDKTRSDGTFESIFFFNFQCPTRWFFFFTPTHSLPSLQW